MPCVAACKPRTAHNGAAPDDPDRLDRDGDGIACEAQ
ncbi:excalibur calcium-binding domain-containing protein [Streptomyces sp. NPDC052015]